MATSLSESDEEENESDEDELLKVKNFLAFTVNQEDNKSVPFDDFSVMCMLINKGLMIKCMINGWNLLRKCNLLSLKNQIYWKERKSCL